MLFVWSSVFLQTFATMLFSSHLQSQLRNSQELWFPPRSCSLSALYENDTPTSQKKEWENWRPSQQFWFEFEENFVWVALTNNYESCRWWRGNLCRPIPFNHFWAIPGPEFQLLFFYFDLSSVDSARERDHIFVPTWIGGPASPSHNSVPCRNILIAVPGILHEPSFFVE